MRCLFPVECFHCLGPLPPRTDITVRIYCSSSCAQAAKREKARKAQAARPKAQRPRTTPPVVAIELRPSQTRPCSCGGVITRQGERGPWPTYCSRSCRDRAAYAAARDAGTLVRPARVPKPRTPEPCALDGCESTFVRTTGTQRCCSKRCAATLRAAEAPRCEVDGCARPVVAQQLCKAHHTALRRAEGYQQETREWDDRMRDAYHRRRAREREAATGEPVLRTKIAERDQWTCHLCLLAVDPELEYPAKMSASLDHVIPLSRGGSHDPSNVKLAHLTCNMSKGDRLLEEMPVGLGR